MPAVATGNFCHDVNYENLSTSGYSKLCHRRPRVVGQDHAKRGHARVRRRHLTHGPHRRRLHGVGLSRQRKEPADFGLGVVVAHGMGGKEIQHHRHAGLPRFHQRRPGRVARRRFRAGGGSCPARPRRWHRAGVELRDRLRHSQDDRGECHGQGERGFRRGGKAIAGAVWPACFSVERAGKSRPRLQPRAGRVAQRNRDLRDRFQRQIQGGTGHRRVGGEGQGVARPAHRTHRRIRRRR